MLEEVANSGVGSAADSLNILTLCVIRRTGTTEKERRLITWIRENGEEKEGAETR